MEQSSEKISFLFVDLQFQITFTFHLLKSVHVSFHSPSKWVKKIDINFTFLILLFLLIAFTWTVSSMFCFSLSLSLNYFLQPPAFSKAALSGKFEAEHWTIILIIFTSMDNNHLNFGQICCDCASVKVWPDFAPLSRRRPTPLTLYFISFLESIIVLLCFF